MRPQPMIATRRFFIVFEVLVVFYLDAVAPLNPTCRLPKLSLVTSEKAEVPWVASGK